jgi:NAD(P)-dependent dehydrogenase (short-subunit alcohol dehydrogenase family)
MGRESALAFAREGASVVGCDVTVEAAKDTVEIVRGAGGEMVSMHPCDLSQPADCQALVDLALNAFGRIDVLFNLAAVAYFNRLLGRLGRTKWRTSHCSWPRTRVRT